MIQKRIIPICFALILALMCCACASEPAPPESESPEQVVEKMQAALSETPCGQAQLVMNLSMTMDAGEYGSMDMSSTITNDITLSQEPVSGYTVATVDIDYGGEKSQTVTENYSVVEDGALVSYIHSSGIWLRLSTGQTAESLAKSASSVRIDVDSADIDDTVTEWEGKEAICLTTQLSGDTIQSFLDGILQNISQQVGSPNEATETAGAIDYSALRCEARIYLDPETYLPMTEEMAFSGMNDVLNSLYAEMGITVDAASCTVIGTFLSYEPQPETVLPEGAQEKAEAWTRLLSGEPDNGDGTFTIREGTVLTDIIPPEGFELTEKGYDHLYFKRDDSRQVKYTMVYGFAESFTAMIDQQIGRYESLAENISREQMTLAGDALSFDCDIVGVDWPSYEEGLLYAWAALGSNGSANYYILVEVCDGYNDGMGHQKSADVTPDEFMDYLNAISLSDLAD